MKKSATTFIKHIISVFSSIAKSKSLAIKRKTGALKDRLVMFSLLKNKKIPLGAIISHKIHAILGQQEKGEHDNSDDIDNTKAIVLYNCYDGRENDTYYDDNDDDDKYPDLRHTLFDEDELDLGDPSGSVIDLVRNSKEEGEDFKLEDEIDHVADLFIMKFHKRIRLQKLESFKRYQDMLERSS